MDCYHFIDTELTPDKLKSQSNLVFGRKFVIKSFRWLPGIAGA
ncbi:MAG: hypothetical protein ACO3JG_02905 [Luteolibacter sp.]